MRFKDFDDDELLDESFEDEEYIEDTAEEYAGEVSEEYVEEYPGEEAEGYSDEYVEESAEEYVEEEYLDGDSEEYSDENYEEEFEEYEEECSERFENETLNSDDSFSEENAWEGEEYSENIDEEFSYDGDDLDDEYEEPPMAQEVEIEVDEVVYEDDTIISEEYDETQYTTDMDYDAAQYDETEESQYIAPQYAANIDYEARYRKTAESFRNSRKNVSAKLEETGFLSEEDEEESSSSSKVGIRIAIAAAAAVLILLAVTVISIVSLRKGTPTKYSAEGVVLHDELMGVGAPIEGITFIGEKGISAALQTKKYEISNMLAELEKEPEEVEEGYTESELQTNVTMSLETVSVLKDLKVKLVNKSSGKLLANVPFSVSVTYPDGKTKTWTDDDRDGIIYYSDLKAGKYKLSFVDIEDEKYSSYGRPTVAEISVKDKIDYKAVDVSNEILDPSKINEGKEDTIRGGADEGGSAMKDTVAFVESKTVDSYVKVDKSQIALSVSLASLNGRMIFARTADIGGGAGGDQGGAGAETPSMAASKDSVSVNVGASDSVSFTASGIDGEVTYALTSAGDSAVANISISGNTVEVTGVAAGTTSFTVADSEGKASKSVSVTVTAVAPTAKIEITGSAPSLYAGKSANVSISLTGLTAAGVTVSSSDSQIATGALTADNTLTVTAGTKGGTATITLTKSDDSNVTASVNVTVVGSGEKLKTSDGTQLYVKDGDNYREATYADYNTYSEFYKAVKVYNGWQTINGNKYYYKEDGTYVTGEQVIQGIPYNFDSNGVLVAGGGVLGIDVSKWNGKIDWNKVKASGVSYVIIRIGYRGSTAGGLIDDANFKTNIAGANAAGLKVGVYWVTQAINDVEAVEEASAVLNRISGYKVSYPVFLDVETSGGRGDKIDKATRTSVCKTFCQTIQNAGYTAGIYANKSWLTTKMDASQLSSYKIWCAQYYSSCTYTGTYHMWQYTDSGSINGISGKVDLNMSYLGY